MAYKKTVKKKSAPKKSTSKKTTPKAPTKVKGVDVSDLTSRQRMSMKTHAKHHTAKHIKGMVASMKKGKTFTQSHKEAMKKVGK
tara:strand:- start:19 stop:270 length:252 start_codon:yes stop_codon:yes gene_type:complete